MDQKYKVKVKMRRPLLWPFIKLLAPKAEWGKVVMTWGNWLYVAHAGQLRRDILEHEAVHARQQKYSKIYGFFWCLRYLLDEKFRLRAEVEACRAQYKFLANGYGANSRERFAILDGIAGNLASGLYGPLSRSNARELLRDDTIKLL